MSENGSLSRAPTVIDKYLVFAFGVAFVSVLLWLVFRTNEPLNRDQAKLVHLVSALAAAGVGAALPGTLELKHRLLLRASGAVALFVLVFVFEPQRAVAPDGTWPKSEASSVVERHLGLTDAGRFSDAYDALAPEARRRFSRQEFVDAFKVGRERYGEVLKRVKAGVSGAATLPDGTKGPFKVFGFVTTFKSGATVQEPVWAMAIGKDEWAVLSHTVTPCQDANCGAPPPEAPKQP